MTPFLVDGTRYPLVVIRVRARFEITDLAAVFAEVGQQLARGGGAGLVVDLRGAEAAWFPPTVRRALGDILHRFRREHPNTVRANAIVIRSAIGRGIVTAIWWVSPPTAPSEMFASVVEAEAWVLAALRNAP
jgi:hypothetical protein